MRTLVNILTDSDGNRQQVYSGLLLILLSVFVSVSDFILFLPFEFSQPSLLHLGSIILALLVTVAAPRISGAVPRRFFMGLAFVAFYGLWSYQLYLNQSVNLVLLSGLMLLTVWYGIQGRYPFWITSVALIVLLVVLAIFTGLLPQTLVVYALLLILAISVAAFARSRQPTATTTETRSLAESEYLPESVNIEQEARLEPVLNLDAEIAAVEMVDDQGPNWEQVLRELHNELKNTSDTDALLKKMLVFISGTIEIEAAAVGMIQDRSLNRITQYGPDELIHSRELAWNNERIRTLIQTQQATVNQQNFANPDGKKVKLYRIDVPVISNNKTVGIITLLRTSLLFNEHEVALASSIVFHSMVALRQARLQEEVKRLSTSTVNKALYTREQFIGKAKQVLATLDKPRVFSLLIVEIDNFDEAQDKHGREAAGKLYKVVANTLMSVMRADDALGNYGKEGFIILLHEADLLEGKKLAELMRSKVSQAKCKLGDVVVTTTISIGLTTASDTGEDMPSLIRKADMGLFVAKENGRNTVKVSL